jgi:hypothetical protein
MLLDIVKERNRPFSGGTDSHGYGAASKWSEAPYECLESIRDFVARKKQ